MYLNLPKDCLKLKVYEYSMNKPSYKNYRGRFFTLIEVVIAVAVLGLAMLWGMSILSMSKVRMIKAYERWENEHMLSQAAEYYLLNGGTGVIPQDLFPYSGYTASCVVSQCNDLPAGVPLVIGNWGIVTYDIQLKDSYGKIISETKVDKINAQINSQPQ